MKKRKLVQSSESGKDSKSGSLKEAVINTLPEVKILNLSDIRPDPENPRFISPEAISGLKESLSGFGLVNLPVINKRNMTIAAGHQRFKVMLDAGVKKALCILIDLDPKKAKLLNVTLNNQKIMGAWSDAIGPLLEQLRDDYPEQFISLKLEELRKDVSKQSERLQVIKKKKNNLTVASIFQILIKCPDEEYQQDVCETLRSQGYECEAVTL